ncbi:MAG: hypothetical protein EOO10_14735 [Chitinophagaceae bacterium]|nr:MAG: hypothetical protein EOO10_14735 [Chitinophagaceae bacterium]
MKRFLLFGLVATAFAACSKDKFKTVPQVEIKSFGPEQVTKGQIIRLQARVTDKEGDLQDSVVFARKVFTLTGLLLSQESDSVRANLKDLGVPTRTDVELQLEMIYGESNQNYPRVNGNNSVDRKFAVGVYIKDKAGNRSQYVESDTIILKRIQ